MSSSMEVTLGYDYSTGDFLAFVTLVHKLYWLFYKVAKDAPEDFKKLVRDIGALFECISTLDEEATKPGSPLGRAKQERVRAVKNLISRGEVTLERLQTWAEKHETLREISRPKMKQWYDKARWAYNIPELDAMRKQVGYTPSQSDCGEGIANPGPVGTWSCWVHEIILELTGQVMIPRQQNPSFVQMLIKEWFSTIGNIAKTRVSMKCSQNQSWARLSRITRRFCSGIGQQLQRTSGTRLVNYG